ncbi:MAG: DinB family protein [Chloroflexota bacterium]
MIVQQYQKIWRYNNWAWDYVFESMVNLTEDEYRQERPFFWGSLHGLMSHCLAAEIIWINRLNGNSPKALLGADDFSSLSTIIDQWQPVRQQWHVYLGNLTEEQAGSICQYTSTEGELRQNVVADIISHAANHATDHRSQMTPILAQLGHPTPELDYLFYCLSLQS